MTAPGRERGRGRAKIYIPRRQISHRRTGRARPPESAIPESRAWRSLNLFPFDQRFFPSFQESAGTEATCASRVMSEIAMLRQPLHWEIILYGQTGGNLVRILAFVILAFVALPSISREDRSAQNAAIATKPFTLRQLWTLDATYSDEQRGVTFRYPRIWKPATQFGYHPPALTSQMESKPIAGFGYLEDGFPRSQIVGPYSATNLEGFGIVYSAISTASASECEAKAKASSVSDEHQRTAIVFGDRSFSVHETGEWGMSQNTTGKLYATYARPICYLFETDVSLASPELAIRALTAAQLHLINTHLLAIMKSVRIVPSGKAK
jgi:hypothetical protein